MLENQSLANQDAVFLSIIIPAYNEERRLGRTLDSVSEYLKKQSWKAEVLVVSDGSTDGTVALVKNFCVDHSNFFVIENAANQGKGGAVKQGMLQARGQVRLFMDADSSTQITELDKLLPRIKQSSVEATGDDVAIASLGVPGAEVNQAEYLARTLAGKIGNWFIRFLVLPGIHDTQRGFKLFTAEAAKAIFSKTVITGWGFDVEVLALARRFGFSVVEVPIRWAHDPDSRVRASAYPQVLWQVVQVWWRLKKEISNKR